ncbi:hypothetical protein LCGC14_1267240 [marine sediment metagenome]|uniref:Uncharacterized protein n=1 Tax=marine sediment metagenome TaxID=412755 RepID=A0A0F9P2B4_9ZZZZ
MSRIDRKYIERLQQLQKDNDDVEYIHRMADMVLRDILTELSYVELVEEYDKVDKWYA